MLICNKDSGITETRVGMSLIGILHFSPSSALFDRNDVLEKDTLFLGDGDGVDVTAILLAGAAAFSVLCA